MDNQIKFACPHCKKALKVKGELGGKKAKCPGCQKVITIPSASPVPKAPAKPAVAKPPVANGPSAKDIEAMAAAALTEQPPAEAQAPQEPATIEFTCTFCDEKVSVSADLGGKQTPCPSCRRIVKVPMPVKKGPADWRKTDTSLPSGARRDTEPAPAGAWGSATSAGRVSSQALVEADAIPVVRERVTVRQWIVRGFLVLLAVGMIVGGIVGMRHVRVQNQQNQALDKALAYVPEKNAPPLPPETAAAVCRGAGEYNTRAGKPEDAGKLFRRARGLVGGPDPSFSRSAYLVDIAVNQADLGGDKQEVINGTHIPWDTVQKDLHQTLQNLPSLEARTEALRQLTPKLVARKQGALAISLVFMLAKTTETPELLAVVGLEMFRAGDRQAAEDVAKQASAPYVLKPGAPGKDQPKRPPMSPTVVTLLMVLNPQAPVDKSLDSVRDETGEVNEDLKRIGVAAGLALNGKVPEARAIANAKGEPQFRFRALLALAAVTAQSNPADAKPDVEAAAALTEGELAKSTLSPWWLLSLVKLGLQAGLPDDRIQRLIGRLKEGDRARAQLEIVRSRLASSTQADVEGLTKAAADPSPNGLVLETLARHNAHHGSSAAVMQAVDGWDDKIRPFGYIGVALGVQDASR